ncbi:hypothetical protein [Methylobacter marinus]|uniref:hypothetical protein n=1 Tax=Methylobacter marinus TaxID=34058 RepID=UPI00037E5167|nr:hypothetical protein [Methylobacter marinus]
MNFRRLCFNTFACLSLICFIGSSVCYLSYKNDLAYLKSVIQSQIGKEHSPHLFAAINHWVYQNQGFRKNHDFFLFKSLGPTPIQVLERGGDCSDKSRLLMAMLDSIDVDSTLVMLYDADNKTPTHTTLEVRNKQLKAVADPVFDLVFPNPANGFYGLQDLRDNPAILPDRLDELIRLRGPSNKIAFYKREQESYQYATTINWNKNGFLRFIADGLKKAGIEPRNIRRPHFLDEPKLLISLMLLLTGSLLLMPVLMIGRKTPVPAYTPGSARVMPEQPRHPLRG